MFYDWGTVYNSTQRTKTKDCRTVPVMISVYVLLTLVPSKGKLLSWWYSDNMSQLKLTSSANSMTIFGLFEFVLL